MTPTDQTSTLEEILGGSLPTTKHSGGKYLRHSDTSQCHNELHIQSIVSGFEEQQENNYKHISVSKTDPP